MTWDIFHFEKVEFKNLQTDACHSRLQTGGDVLLLLGSKGDEG